MSDGYMPPASTIEAERARCIQLRMTGYSVAQAAHMAGLTKDTVQRRLNDIGLPPTAQVSTALVAYAIDNDLIPEASEIGQSLLRWARRLRGGAA